MTYAANTVVSVDKSRAEIEATLVRYGASMYFSGWDEHHAFVRFCVRERHIKMVLPLPKSDEKRFTHHKDRYGVTRSNTPDKALDLYEQAKRSLFRALLLAIKAKLESVESRIETFEQAFLAHIVLPDDTLVGDRVKALVDEAYRTGRMGNLALVAGAGDAHSDVEDAEIAP
jgi:hypothetical protein